MLRKNSIILGILLGTFIPFVGYAFLLELYDILDGAGVISNENMSENFRERTIGLLAICMNLIPFYIYNTRWTIQTMRGIIFPTVLYAFVWVFFYGVKLI